MSDVSLNITLHQGFATIGAAIDKIEECMKRQYHPLKRETKESVKNLDDDVADIVPCGLSYEYFINFHDVDVYWCLCLALHRLNSFYRCKDCVDVFTYLCL